MACSFNRTQSLLSPPWNLPLDVKRHCAEVVWKGYTVIRNAVPAGECAALIDEFRAFEQLNDEIFTANRDQHGHYPRIVNLHTAFPPLISLFARNKMLLTVSDVLFGRRTSLYTSLFYETGSQQPIHRDTPVFSTRPEYLYFGNTVYLEPANDENGCLEVIEGGHLVGELDRERLATDHYGTLDKVKSQDGELWIKYQDSLAVRCQRRGLTTTKLHVQAGDTLIWHPQLPHGGSPIRDKSKTRFSLVMHTTPEGVPVYHQDAFFRPSTPYSETPHWDTRGLTAAKWSRIKAFHSTKRERLSVGRVPSARLLRVLASGLRPVPRAIRIAGTLTKVQARSCWVRRLRSSSSRAGQRSPGPNSIPPGTCGATPTSAWCWTPPTRTPMPCCGSIWSPASRSAIRQIPGSTRRGICKNTPALLPPSAGENTPPASTSTAARAMAAVAALVV